MSKPLIGYHATMRGSEEPVDRKHRPGRFTARFVQAGSAVSAVVEPQMASATQNQFAREIDPASLASQCEWLARRRVVWVLDRLSV